MADTTEGRWVPLAEACAFFGRSERTMRRWIKSGSPRSKREGGRVYVLIHATEESLADTEADMTGAPADKADMSATVADLEAQVSDLSATRDRLQDLNEQLASERDYLRQALAAALSKIPEIPADTTPAQSDHPPRRWWEFWK